MLIINGPQIRENLHLFLDHYANLSKEDRYFRFFNTMGPSAIRDWILKITENVNHHYFFIEEDENGHYIGISSLIVYDNNTADIAISVNENFRNRGIAKKLINSVINYAKSLGIKKVFFESLVENIKCKHLYSNLGFSYSYNQERECIVGSLSLVS